MIVAITVTDAGSVEQHRMIQQGSIAVFGFAHPFSR